MSMNAPVSLFGAVNASMLAAIPTGSASQVSMAGLVFPNWKRKAKRWIPSVF